MQHTQATIDAVSRAGELLIRAAAALGALPRDVQIELGALSHGKMLTVCLDKAIDAAAELSPSVRDSLHAHPPAGFVGPVDQFSVRA
jgi:hypothetical protein